MMGGGWTGGTGRMMGGWKDGKEVGRQMMEVRVNDGWKDGSGVGGMMVEGRMGGWMGGGKTDERGRMDGSGKMDGRWEDG